MKIKQRMLYAITAGKYMGDFLVFTETKPSNNSYKAITLPNLEEILIPAKDVEEGVKLKILDPVERLSKKVYDDTVKQIDIKRQKLIEEQEKAINEYHNRREQLTASVVLDGEVSEERLDE